LLKISFKFTDLQKVYLFTHTLTIVYRLTVQEVVCGYLLHVIRNTADIVYIISQKQRVLDGLKLGSGLLLIVVNCCAACRAATCVGYMKCLLSLTIVPFGLHFQLGLLCKSTEIPCLIYAQPD